MPDGEYLGMVANRKAKLYPYLSACGVASPESLSESTRKGLVGEVLARKDKMAGWCPPELDLLARAPAGHGQAPAPADPTAQIRRLAAADDLGEEDEDRRAEGGDDDLGEDAWDE